MYFFLNKRNCAVRGKSGYGNIKVYWLYYFCFFVFFLGGMIGIIVKLNEIIGRIISMLGSEFVLGFSNELNNYK